MLRRVSDNVRVVPTQWGILNFDTPASAVMEKAGGLYLITFSVVLVPSV